jgi:hypothetical protein
MEIILLYALVTSACFYLGSRAMITSWLWSRYPPRLSRFMDCAACTGFWYGTALTLVLGAWLDITPFALPLVAAPIIGLASLVWTPIVAGLMHVALERLGSVMIEPYVPVAERTVEVLPTVFAENEGAAKEMEAEIRRSIGLAIVPDDEPPKAA